MDCLQDYAGAVEDFSAAIALEPGNADFYHNRGFALRKQVRPQATVGTGGAGGQAGRQTGGQAGGPRESCMIWARCGQRGCTAAVPSAPGAPPSSDVQQAHGSVVQLNFWD